MDNEGYPTEDDLKSIKEWDPKDFLGLIDFIKDNWYCSDCVKIKWHKDFINEWELRVELVTVGWSGNESIIYALLDNFAWGTLWYAEWYRGGKYVFKIAPVNCGFKLVSDYCKENNISRQAVHQNKHLYQFIKVKPKIIYCLKLTSK